MSAPPAGELAAAGALLALGAGISAFGLARLARAAVPPPPRPFARLRGSDLVLAFALLLLLPALIARLWAGDLRQLTVLGLLLLNLAVVLAALAWLRWRAGREPPPPPPPRTLAWALGAYLWSVPAGLALLRVNALLVQAWSGTPPEQSVGDALRAASGPSLAGALVLAVVVQPVVEELLFRGYLQRFLAARPDIGPVRALILSAAVFALFHESAVVLPIFAIGLLFGWVYWRTGSLHASILLHVLHNGIGTLGLLLLSRDSSP